MATIAKTTTTAQDNGSQKMIMIESSAPKYLSNNVVVHDLKASFSPRSNIRERIPSLPQLWKRRHSARKERLQPKTSPKPSHQGAEQPKVHPRPPLEQASSERTQPNIEGLEVSIPLSLKDRLKTCTLSSSLQLTADENAVFERTDIEKLEQFSTFLHKNSPALFHGLPCRNLVLTPVAITGPSASWSSICIKGLTKETEITSFHAILSQRWVRARYKPWTLCYDNSLVERVASAATYQTNMCEAPETICGTLLRTEDPGNAAWISTIGGIIEVDGVLLAVTSAHHPSNADSSSDENILDSAYGSPGASVVDDLVEKGAIDMDVDSALVIDTWKEVERQGSLVTAFSTSPVVFSNPPRTTSPIPWSDFNNTNFLESSDWRLLNIDNERQLPNCIPFQPSGERSSRGAQDTAIAHPPKYLVAYPAELSKKGVYILAGVSGVCPGMLSANISFLNIRGEGPRTVWSVKLETGFEIKKGDSGSWVIDAETSNILGYVVAISAGFAYLIPLADLFRQILQALKRGANISVPSAFKLLIRLARYHFSAEPYGKTPLSDGYALEALSPRALDTASSDEMTKFLRLAIAYGEDVGLLVRLVCSIDAEFLSRLASFSTWSSEQRGKVDQDLASVLMRMENRMALSASGLKINAAPLSIPLVDIEKERAFQAPTRRAPLTRQTWIIMKRSLFNMLPEISWSSLLFWEPHHIELLGMALFIALFYITILGLGAASGVTVAAVLTHMESLPYSRKLLGNGAIGGMVMTTILTFQLAACSKMLPLKRSGGPILALSVFLLSLSFARTLFTALALVSRFHVPDPRPIFIGATLAAFPLILEFSFIFSRTLSWISILAPGLDALAGFVFAVTCHHYGYEFSRYNSAAAAAAIYGAMNWSVVWVAWMWYYGVYDSHQS